MASSKQPSPHPELEGSQRLPSNGTYRPGGRRGSACVDVGGGGMRGVDLGTPRSVSMRLDRREEAVHAQLEGALFLEEARDAHEAQRRRLPEVNLALDERLERREALGLVETARLDVLQDDADVEERLVEVLPVRLDLRERRVEIADALT